MPFPDPDERSGDGRWLRVKFAIVLVLFLVAFAAGAHELLRSLSGLL
jgi:hypothetical protein